LERHRYLFSFICSSILLYGSGIDEAIEGITHKGELRFGAIQTKDSLDRVDTTVAFGGRVSLSTKPINGLSATGTFFTTNALFGRDEEPMFLDSNGKSYSILGESYIKFNIANTTLKAGRQIVDTPYADSDDIGMVPNSFEGYTLVNKDVENTTIVLAWLDKWAGVDAPTPEKFSELLDDKGVFTTGLIYSKDEVEAQYWYYDLDDISFHYLEADFNSDSLEFGLQYSDQDNDNSVYGAKLKANFHDLGLGIAYNRVDGVVTNGFGGGPFFTSSEDHTIADVKDQEAVAYSLEYEIDKFNFGVTHVNFDKGEDETDYSMSFKVNKNHSLDLIYSDMFDDGSMFRFFAKYKF